MKNKVYGKIIFEGKGRTRFVPVGEEDNRGIPHATLDMALTYAKELSADPHVILQVCSATQIEKEVKEAKKPKGEKVKNEEKA